MKSKIFLALFLVFTLLGFASAYQYYTISDSELNSGFTRTLSDGDEFKFSIDGKDYHIMASGIHRTSADMSIPPINSLQIINLNEKQEFELNGDNYYDISLIMSDSNWSTNEYGYSTDFKGTFTIKKIHEEIPANTILPDSCFKYYTCSDGTKVQYCEYSGQGCGCKSPQSLCPAPSSGGGGGGASVNNTGSSGGGGGGGTILNGTAPSGGGGGGGSSSSTCEKIYNCSDGSQVQYCFIRQFYNEDGEVTGAGCGCKSNPQSLCTAPSGGGGGGSGGQPIIINSSSGGGGGSGNIGTNVTPIICNGCIIGNKCAPIGYRQEERYCNINSEFISQLSADSSCDNNFECSTNLCIDSKCVSSGLWQKFIRWLNRLFGG